MKVVIIKQKYIGDLYIDDCAMKKNLPNLIFQFLGEKKTDGTNKLINLVLTPDDYVLQFRIGTEVFFLKKLIKISLKLYIYIYYYN